jgi:hypothetical protein
VEEEPGVEVEGVEEPEEPERVEEPEEPERVEEDP